jgi:hypothetical protein
MNIKILELDNSSDYIIVYNGINYSVLPDIKIYEIVKQLEKLNERGIHNATHQKTKQ